MAQLASLTVVAHGKATCHLLLCLRANVSSSNVQVGDPDGDRVFVIDLGNAHSVHDLLDRQLDQCAERLNILDRRNHLIVERG